jgi:glycosyltransferase involved in cell wall biosynthesis
LKVIQAIRRIISARRIKKDWNTDVCLSFGTTCDYINAFSKGKEDVFLSIRGYSDVALAPSILKRLWNNIVYSKAIGIICVSKKIVDRGKEFYPKHSSKFTLLYNPYDFERINELRKKELTCYDDLFRNNKVIISVGTYRYEKGYWHLVKAFYIARKSYADIKLFIMGSEQPGHKAKLTKLVADLGLSDDVILSGFDENPLKYIDRSEIYVLSSVFEGFPNALVEAMACVVPVVAADCRSGPREILSEGDPFAIATDVEHQDYGLLAPPMNIEENYDPNIIEECDRQLACAIECYLNDEYLADEYAKRARTGAERFTEADCMVTLRKIIENGVSA